MERTKKAIQSQLVQIVVFAEVGSLSEVLEMRLRHSFAVTTSTMTKYYSLEQLTHQT